MPGDIIPFLPELISVAFISMLAIISPGPDVAIVIRNSLIHSRRIGFYTTVGIVAGIAVHLTYTLLGIGVVITSSPFLFWIIKLVACAYLFYVGVMALRAKKGDYNLEPSTSSEKTPKPFAAIRSGFLINIFNPKVMLFFFSLFTVFISPNTPTPILLLYGFIVCIEVFAIMNFLVLFFSNPKVRSFFAKSFHWVDRITGVLLIVLAISILKVTVS